jgi:hypothetical protein
MGKVAKRAKGRKGEMRKRDVSKVLNDTSWLMVLFGPSNSHGESGSAGVEGEEIQEVKQKNIWGVVLKSEQATRNTLKI